MKRKLFLTIVITLSLLLLSLAIIWFAHTRTIEGALVDLKNSLSKNGIQLQINKISFTPVSPLHIKASFKDVKLSIKNANNNQDYLQIWVGSLRS